jgi:hypothetical protein
MRYRRLVAAVAGQLTRIRLRRIVDVCGGQSEVGRLLGVDRSRVSRWLAGDEPDQRNQARLEALEFVITRLLQTYAPPTARKWLTGTNAHLGNRRPLDLLKRNRVAEVIAAIEQDELGSYA